LGTHNIEIHVRLVDGKLIGKDKTVALVGWKTDPQKE